MIDILHAEFFKFKGMLKRYYIDSIAEIISYFILFVGLSFTILNNQLSSEQALFQLVVGIFIWYVGINSIAVFTFILQEEMQLGTLEQIYLTRVSLTKMLLGRAIGTFVFDAVSGVVLSMSTVFVVSLFSSGVSFVEIFQLQVNVPAMLIVLVLTMIGIYGFSFILAGLSIVYKRISAITVILNYMFLFFTGITLAGSVLPPLLDAFAKGLPITWGIENLRAIVVEEQAFTMLVASPAFVSLMINSGLYMLVGLLVFNMMTKRAKKDGSLGHY